MLCCTAPRLLRHSIHSEILTFPKFLPIYKQMFFIRMLLDQRLNLNLILWFVVISCWERSVWWVSCWLLDLQKDHWASMPSAPLIRNKVGSVVILELSALTHWEDDYPIPYKDLSPLFLPNYHFLTRDFSWILPINQCLGEENPQFFLLCLLMFYGEYFTLVKNTKKFNVIW